MNIWEKIKEYIKDKKYYILAYLLLSFASPLKEIFLPYYYGKFIEEASNGRNPTGVLTRIGIIYCSIQLMFSGMEYLDSYILPEFESYIRKQFIVDIFAKYSENVGDIELGSMIYKIANLPHVINELTFELRYRIIPALYVLFFFIAYLYTIDSKLATFSLMALILVFSLILSVGKSCDKISMQCAETKTSLHEDIEDKLANIHTIYNSLSHDSELKDIDSIHESMEHVQSSVITCIANIKIFLNISYSLFFIIVTGYAYQLFITKKITVSQLSSIFMIVSYAINQFAAITDSIPNFVHNIGLLTKIQKDLDNMKDLNYNENTDDIKDFDIDIQNISVKRGDFLILKDFNLKIPEKSALCIYGKIGSGKSTVAYAILKYIPILSGKIIFGGKERNKTTLRKYIAFVPQKQYFFNKSLLYNMTYGLEDTPFLREKIQKLFIKYNIGDIFGKHTLDSIVGKGASNISGGQKQIISLIKVILDDTKKVVILDEPTASLDNSTTEKIIDMIIDISKTKTIIVITHDLALRNLFDKVLNMDDYTLIR